jgi:lipopolysaccharide exporter
MLLRQEAGSASGRFATSRSDSSGDGGSGGGAANGPADPAPEAQEAVPGGRDEGSSLTRRTTAGVGWNWGAFVVTAAVQLVYTAVTSRVLTPADFGLVAAALLSVRFVTYFSRFGLSSAVVQRERLGRLEESTALRLSALFALGFGFLVLLLAPVLGVLVRSPETAQITRWLSVGVALTALTTVPEALLRRRLRFRTLSMIQVSSFTVGYLGFGVGAALLGAGVWSLVLSSTSQVAIALVATTLLARPAFRGGFSRSVASGLVRFGGTESVTGFLQFLTGSIDTVAVARYLGPSAIGQYSRATYLVGVPLEYLSSAVSAGLLPGFSRVQHERSRFAGALRIAVGLQAAVVLVVAAVAAAAAPALVPWLLGPGWESAAQVLPFVAAAQAVGFLVSVPGVAAVAKGMVGRLLALQTVSLVVNLALVGAVVLVGPALVPLAAAWSLGSVFRLLLYLVWIVPRLGVTRLELVGRYAFAVLAAAVAAAPVVGVVRFAGSTGFWPMVGSAALGVVLAGLLVVSPLGRTVRTDAGGLRSRLVSS